MSHCQCCLSRRKIQTEKSRLTAQVAHGLCATHHVLVLVELIAHLRVVHVQRLFVSANKTDCNENLLVCVCFFLAKANSHWRV